MFVETIAPEHEFRHPADDTPNYNESSYYNLACAESGVVGWVRIGIQENVPAAQMSALFFLPDGEVLFDHVRSSDTSPGRLVASGLTIEIVEPHARQHVTLEADLAAFADPRVLSDPRAAFRAAPRRRVSMDLTVEANGRSFGTNGEDPATRVEETMALGHFEQLVHTSGRLTVDDRTYDLTGGGLRDHSWGPRDWTGPHYYRWISATFDDGSGLMGLEVRRRDNTLTLEGASARQGVLSEAKFTGIDPVWTEDGFVESGVAEFLVDGSPVTVRATRRLPARHVPLRHRTSKADSDEQARIGYTAYDFETSDGRHGIGIIEVLDVLVDGLPISMSMPLLREPVPTGR